MDENDQCGLLESLPFFRNMTALEIQTRPLGDADCCTAELNTYNYFRPTVSKSLTLKGILLTQASTAALGQSLSEMLSLQALEVKRARNEIILQAEEIEALFGRFNGVLPLHSLIFCDFSITGSIAPLTKSFCFFPSLMELNLAEFDMDEHNLCGLLENLRFLPNLIKLRVVGKPLDHGDCCTAQVNTVGGFPLKSLKELTLYRVYLTPAVATVLGQILPEMSSLQEFVLTGADGSIVKAEEMEALFNGLNKTLPLHHLTFYDFNVRGSLAALVKSFRFLPNLREVHVGGFRGKLNMDEHNLCALLESLRFIPNLKVLIVEGRPQGDAHCGTAELNVMANITHKTLEHLRLDGISLTPVSAAALGRSLPEMASLQVLEVTGRDKHILQREEMEALFGGFNKAMPLRELTFSDFSVRGCLAPLIKSLRFFPNLTELKLERLNMNENDKCGLLKSFELIRNLTEFSVCVRRWSDLDSFHYYTSELNAFAFAFDRLTPGRVKKGLKLGGISLTPAVSAVLGQVLPEMSSLQVLQFTQMDGSILQVEEMEALFGGFNKQMPLCQLALHDLSVRGCLAPLFRSLRFFPNLIELDLEKLNMDEHDLRGLLESFQFIPNLQELNLSGNPLGHAVTFIVPHIINLKKLRLLWIDETNHSEEDLIYVRDTVQQALPELEICRGLLSECNQMYSGMPLKLKETNISTKHNRLKIPTGGRQTS